MEYQQAKIAGILQRIFTFQGRNCNFKASATISSTKVLKNAGQYQGKYLGAEAIKNALLVAGGERGEMSLQAEACYHLLKVMVIC